MHQRFHAASTSRVLQTIALVALSTGFAFAGTVDFAPAIELDVEVQEEVGQQVYVDQCQSCHGAEGKGDGSAARFVDPKPSDLTLGEWKHAEGGTVEAVAAVVKAGIDDTAMTPFEGTLSDEQIAAVASYVINIIAGGADSGR